MKIVVSGHISIVDNKLTQARYDAIVSPVRLSYLINKPVAQDRSMLLGSPRVMACTVAPPPPAITAPAHLASC
jgi:hypothetical protein